jgi:hypothetical protein
MELTDTRIAALLDAYLKADYRWELDGQWRRFHVGRVAEDIEAAFPQARCFALLSAWNPASVPRDDAANREEDAALLRLIEEMGYARRPAFSSAPDRSWREPSWLAVDMPAGVLDALARRFGQLASLGWERGQPVRLRMDASPQPDAASEYVDWLK